MARTCSITDQTNRRDPFRGAAVAGVAIAAAAAFAQAATTTPALGDPQTRYTSQPFAAQRQEWPALQRDMKPVPDSGKARAGWPAARHWSPAAIRGSAAPRRPPSY